MYPTMLSFFQQFSHLYDQWLKSYSPPTYSIDSLAAGIAHEIKNPLALIKTNLQLLELEDIRHTHKRNFSVMYRELDRIEQLVLEFLDLSKPRCYEFCMIDISGLIEETVLLFQPEASRKSINIHTSLLPQVSVYGDSSRLKQVLVNIIKNAFEAMDFSGNLYIDLGFVDSDFVIIRIEDTGIGISEDLIPHICNPFFSTKKDGTGLGLSISKQIVSDHRGTLSIKSTPSKGTVFTILLPASASKNA